VTDDEGCGTNGGLRVTNGGFTVPCLLALLAFFTPRLVLFLLWLFSNFITRAYATHLWPLVGFFFLPFTTLAYAAAINWNGRVDGGYFFLVLVAALMDLGVVGGGYKGRSRWS
jgi:hypothetical protein